MLLLSNKNLFVYFSEESVESLIAKFTASISDNDLDILQDKIMPERKKSW